MKLDKKIIVKYENQWIAVRSNQSVIEANKNLDKLHERLKKLNIKGATVLFIPPFTVLTPFELCRN